MSQQKLNPGDIVRLRKNSNLMSGWRGNGVVIGQLGDQVTFQKPEQGHAQAMRHELVRVKLAVTTGGPA